MTTPPPEQAGDRPTRRANRLARSTSPYLLQHAYNPVDWFAWGDEAFAEARRRDVPIFLSIGYSTCYWCHVMERESFENESIAAVMNERFVCVKVDREERPDVDDIYMTATQIMTGHGGWPMNVFLEPTTLKPFWCGTYFPPVARPDIGVPAFPHVLTNISDAFKGKRPEVIEQAEQIAGLVKERLKPVARAAAIDGIGAVTGAVSGLLRSLDRNHGGFGGAPKFPQPVFLEFLLDARASAGSPETREAIDVALRLTLDKMMIGGMHDQIGGGFHRYSVDATWTVPHFEKMLYDNALLAGIYAQAGAEFADAEYARTARTTCEYVLREMLLPGGGFASAQDAEVDGREGLNYLWTNDEVRAPLSKEDAEFALRVFSMDSGPNFRDPHHPAEPARSVLRLSDRPDKIAAELGLSIGAFHDRRARVAATLLAARAGRKQPGRDDKVLASWNGLMIAALARVGRLQRGTHLIAASRAAADFILNQMRTPDGALVRSVRDGERGGPAFLEDYAFVIEGLVSLADALSEKSDSEKYMAHARDLAQGAVARFADASGVFFDAPSDAKDLFVRARSIHDGAIPCANSVLLHALLDLFARDQDPSMLRYAERLLRSLAEPIAEMPLGIANASRAVLRVLTDPRFSRTGMADVLRGSARKQPEQPDSFTPVEIYASEERLRIGPELPGSARLVMKIAPGYHVIAAEPWVDDPASAARGLIPLRVHVVGGGGLRVYADYPPGVPMPEAPEGIGRPRVYEGEIEFEIAVEADGKMTGRPLLAITFQACSATECLHPRAVELDIAIDPA